MKNTTISWTDHTFNPWLGCTRISPACDNCYAATLVEGRFKIANWGANQPRKRTSAQNWNQPKIWNKEAARSQIRKRVFCASLSDVFDNESPPEWRVDLLKLVAETPCLDWLFLTKRIGNVNAMMTTAFSDGWPQHEAVWHRWGEFFKNISIGATICNQAEANRDTQKLLRTHAKKKFLSVEPMLGPINLERPMLGPDLDQGGGGAICQPWMIQSGIDLVIVGGESGKNARPMHPDWARSLRDQCASADVPFHFKQWGEWQIASIENGHHNSDMKENGAYWLDVDGSIHTPSSTGLKHPCAMIKVGTKKTGRTLDGVTHDGRIKS